MIERRILAAFPGKGENRLIRAALFEIAWAFEEYELEECLVGPTLNQIIASGQLEPEEVSILTGKLRETSVRLRSAAKRIEAAIIDIKILMTDREAVARNGP